MEPKNNSVKKAVNKKGIMKFPTLNNSSSFDELYNVDDEELNKQMQYKQNRDGKKLQLIAKLNHLKTRLTKAEVTYRRSLVDPLVDSIEIAIDIKCLNEQIELTKNLLVSLFPDTKDLML